MGSVLGNADRSAVYLLSYRPPTLVDLCGVSYTRLARRCFTARTLRASRHTGLRQNSCREVDLDAYEEDETLPSYVHFAFVVWSTKSLARRSYCLGFELLSILAFRLAVLLEELELRLKGANFGQGAHAAELSISTVLNLFDKTRLPWKMSFSEESFRRSTRILRWSGAWFIQDATSSPDRAPLKRTLTRPYAWYSALCLSTLFIIESGLIFWTLLFSFGMRKMFLNTLYVVLHCTVVSKTFLSVLSLSLNSNKFKKLMAKARHFETSRNFRPLPQEKRLVSKGALRIWGQGILILVFVIIRNMDMMYMVDIRSIPLLIVLNLVLGSASVLLVVYDGAYSTVLKALVEIFLAYLQKAVYTLKSARHVTGSTGDHHAGSLPPGRQLHTGSSQYERYWNTTLDKRSNGMHAFGNNEKRDLKEKP
ncbi:hypothetical protein HPB50_007308 [Hyalomma asiaticum]|uniref:Uncharacterized protein n=1 Tax=Hyalomma asiaticum TaxID=266040 RepID=A0ACB7SCE1_HYAAI|nr:hypothetical protein HPB50_007308 [Hyalomma asiaticum]